MSAVLRWVLAHKMAVALTIAVAGFVTSYVAWLDAHDALVATRAVAAERLEDLEAATARADSLYTVRVRTDSQVAIAQAHISELRREAERRATVADSLARLASVEVTTAGDSLRATLDSLYAVVPTELEPLARVARQQHVRERAAQNRLVTALRDQLAATQDLRLAADSTARMWRTRYDALEDAYDASRVECQQCRETVEAMAAGAGQGFGSAVLYTGVGAVVGAVLWATFGF